MSDHSRLSVCAPLVMALLVTFGAGLAPAPAPQAAGPATFTATIGTDAPADFTGDPNFDICQTAPGNHVCTLRAAIMNANRHTGGAIINLPARTYQLQIPGGGLGVDDSTGSLDIYQSVVSLAGAGAGSTIIDGGQLGSVFRIVGDAVVTITAVTIRNGSSANGGGILNASTLTLDHVMVTGNSTEDIGAGVFNQGTLTIQHSTVAGNVAGAAGGGIANGSHLTVFDSTFSNNSTQANGGAIFTNGGPAHFYHVTFVGNLADSDADNFGQGGAIINLGSGADVQLSNSLLADNYVSQTLNMCSGSLTSLDYNLAQTTAGCAIIDSGHDQFNTGEPGVDELADNGGQTPTRALLPGSLALDRIPPGLCRDAAGAAPVPDQRGVARPINGLCDVGAFEGPLVRGLFGRNLVVNGDAEASAGSPTGAEVGVPIWLGGPGLTAVTYNAAGGYPNTGTDPVPANHGANFFAGGISDITGGEQLIDLQPIAAAVQAGGVRFVFSADLGGYRDEDDNAIGVLYFRDSSHTIIGTPIEIGPVMAADRANHTGLLHVSASGTLPAQTADAHVTLGLYRVSPNGPYNDGYADNLSLVLWPRQVFLPFLRR